MTLYEYYVDEMQDLKEEYVLLLSLGVDTKDVRRKMAEVRRVVRRFHLKNN